MLSYVLVAIGGAIGSVLRAWLNTVVVGITGPAFPWGTILINVVGSAVIGFFATLTATDGRFGVSTDLRTFFMVGICGGFTTFSSFSLQTLELARDGRAGQALGNVALSVVLCLLSVSAGYALAMTLRTSAPASLARIAPGGWGDSVLVALHHPDAAAGTLSAVRQLTDGLEPDKTRITVLAVDGPALAAFQPTEEVATRERAQEEVANQREAWTGDMRALLDRWVAEEKADGRTARWIAVRGDGTRAVREHVATAHLLVLEQHPHDETARHRLLAATARSDRPVLLLPAGTEAPIGRVAAIVPQENGAGAAETVRPLLPRDSRIVMLDPAGPETALPAAHEAGADLLAIEYPAHGVPAAHLDAILEAADLPVLLFRSGAA